MNVFIYYVFKINLCFLFIVVLQTIQILPKVKEFGKLYKFQRKWKLIVQTTIYEY